MCCQQLTLGNLDITAEKLTVTRITMSVTLRVVFSLQVRYTE